MNNKIILVTGGTGYIGSHTVVELQKKGYDVIIVDNLSTSRRGVIKAIQKITGITPQFEKVDLCDYKKTEVFFKKHKNISAIIHFAAFKSVGESVEKPLKYYNNNLISLINILNCAEKFNIKRLVFSSSCTVYGQPDKLPISEGSPTKTALSTYGRTKQVCEEIINSVSQKNNIKSISLRYFNAAGAHESSLIGEDFIGTPSYLIPFITQTAIGKRKYLSVFGNDYDTPDGTCIRDYIHVTDLAKAHIAAIERLLIKNDTKNYEVFNIGTGTGYSVLEIINTFEKVSGQKLNYKIVKRRPGDVEKIWASTKYANKELKWKAEKKLDDIISSAWKWEKKINKKKEIEHE
ncbi:MAG: UDP-glucose 4-epimerase GalE [Candidatus Paceibacterota bacterium]|jgi:UDP-glucose 4-epimerase